MSATEHPPPPKTFISYRWTSPEHEDWVLLLATSLRGVGVDVVLDKWHLTEGQDTRLYFDMSSLEAESANFEKIVRWIFGRPFHAAPPIGLPPRYLDEAYSPAATPVLSGERLRQSRGRSVAATTAAATEILAEVGSRTQQLILGLAKVEKREEVAFESMRESFPLIEDTYRAFVELIRGNTPGVVDTIHSFFETVLDKWDYAPLNQPFTRWDNDVLHYFGHECLVGFVALAMQERMFSVAAEVLSMPLYKARAHERTGEAATYRQFLPYLESLESRNRSLKLNRLSLHADLLAEHHEHSVVSFTSFMEADMTLYARGLIAPNFGWHPITSVYLGRAYGSLPTYVRASSRRFYDRLRPLFFEMDPEAFRASVTAALSASKGLRFDYQEVSVPTLLNLEALGSLQ